MNKKHWILAMTLLACTSSTIAAGSKIAGFCEGRIGIGGGFIQVPDGHLDYFGPHGGVSYHYYQQTELMEIRFEPSAPSPSNLKRLTLVETRKKPIKYTIYQFVGQRASFYYAVAERKKRGWITVIGGTLASIVSVFESYADSDIVLERCPEDG